MREGTVQFGPGEPTDREYKIKGKVVLKRKGYTDHKNRKLEATLAYIIPQEGDQRTGFLTAWLPENESESVECVGFIAPPVDSPCRFKVKRSDGNIQDHHLFVMSKGVEDILKKMEGKVVEILVAADNNEELADEARDTDEDIETIDP